MTPWHRYRRRYAWATLCVMAASLLLLMLPTAVGAAAGHKNKRRQQPSSNKPCEGTVTLTDMHGVIQTPGFPNKFPVPIKCRWVIDASNIPHSHDVEIIVYLTQLYVMKGLTVTSHVEYGEEWGKEKLFTVTEKNVTQLSWLRGHTHYMVLDFQLHELEGNHLRALYGLMDVYGFNITYEISTRKDGTVPKSCGVLQCSYLGNCYAERDMSRFWCSCFDGYSGENCSQGPLCAPGRSMCQNGATCSPCGPWPPIYPGHTEPQYFYCRTAGHLGANAVTCYCPAGYTGPHCDVQLRHMDDTEGCSEPGCLSQCPFDGHPSNVCNCPRSPRVLNAGRARFEGTVRLANFPTLSSRHVSDMSLANIIEQELSNYLKNNSSLSRMNDFKVLNITAGGEVTFHFFGAKKDGSRVRDALNKLVKRGQLGNLTFVSTQIAFRQEPTLLLQSVKANINITRGVREGEEFIISCVAQGSSYMTFQWYKDGVFVNSSKATRTIWTHLHPLDTQDQYTASLGVAHATVLDGGVYTCQVEDWGVQQCRSVRIHVPAPPTLNVIPNSVTLQKGDNVSIVCISPNDRQPNTFGYNWTKEKKLFKMKAGSEVWEELRPGGSVLKIINVQKSAKYSCEAHNGSLRTIVEVPVEVLNKTLVPLCPREFVENITWAETKPGVYSIQECPPGFAGTVRRLCTLRDVNMPEWEPPNLSSCFARSLEDSHVNFLKLTYGYQNTTATETMSEYLNYLQSRPTLYSGEGERILSLVQEVIVYVNATESIDEVHNVSKALYKIVDFLLKHRNSIIDIESVAQLQRIVRSQALLVGSLLRTSSEMHENFDSFTVDVSNLDSATIHNLHVPFRQHSYPRWFGDKLDLHIETGGGVQGGGGSETFGNGSFTVAVVSYKNLSEFLPARAVAQTRSGHELEYEIVSGLLGVWVGRDRGRPLQLAPGAMWLDLELRHAAPNTSWDAWNTTCAVADFADAHHWDMDSCTTLAFNATLTRCTCSKTGTFAILLTSRPAYMALTAVHQYHLVILLGCVCCLVQVLVALGVLLLYWWYHRSCLVYLKVQCCTATIGAMAVFLYALCNDLPAESFPYVATFLETFLLVGMSSHLSKLLIVYTELVQLTRVRSLKPTVVGIISGVPLVAICGNHLAHRSIGRQLDSWWLIAGSLVFNIFVISAAVMFVLFVFLYFSVMRKLHLLVTKHLTNSKALHKRIGLLRRSAVIYISMVVMVIASIMYINIRNDVICHYVFSISCAVLGFLQLICYVVKCENSMRAHLAKKLKLHGNDDDFSSDSANSPLSFFTKQEPDAESESAPPRQIRGKGVGRMDSSEGLLLSNSQRKLKYPSSEGAPSTIETYLHSISEDSVEHFEGETRPDGKEDVDLELYNSSPKKYRKSPIDAALYSESEKMYPDHWFLRHPESVVISPSSGQFLRDMPHPPDILTTRVCVELGLVPSPNPSVEANILVEGPSILLCNVEVEPCESIDIQEQIRPTKELSDVEEEVIEPEIVSLERKQPEGREKSHTSEGSSVEDDDNLDGMLDRISLDLDYLLNRSTIPEIQITPATIPLHGRKTSKLPASSVRGQIKEEEEPEQDDTETETETEITNEEDLGIAKTAC